MCCHACVQVLDDYVAMSASNCLAFYDNMSVGSASAATAATLYAENGVKLANLTTFNVTQPGQWDGMNALDTSVRGFELWNLNSCRHAGLVPYADPSCHFARPRSLLQPTMTFPCYKSFLYHDYLCVTHMCVLEIPCPCVYMFDENCLLVERT